MTTWARGFIIPDVAQVHVLFNECLKLAEAVDVASRRTGAVRSTATLAELRRAYQDFNAELRATAETAAAEATKGMIERFDATKANRPNTGSIPAFKDLLFSAPLSVGGFQTGAVGVASIDLLDRAINPNTRGYGPYWRAQEYGTGSVEVPSQIGRVIHGYFAGPGGGDLTPPRAEFSGGGGPHSVFIPGGSQAAAGSGRGPGISGGFGGYGTIAHEDAGRHFIRFGADAAAVAWRGRIAEVQARAIARIHALSAGA